MAMRKLPYFLLSKRMLYNLLFIVGIGTFLVSIFSIKDTLVISRKNAFSSAATKMSIEEQFMNPIAKPVSLYKTTNNDPTDDDLKVKDQKVAEFNQRLNKKCEKLDMTSQYNSTLEMQKLVKNLRHIFVVDNYRLLFCYVPKVACTNWKRLLLILKGVSEAENTNDHMKIHISADSNLRTLSSLPFEQAMFRLQNYTKVMFVREPFARLLSAYRDKLEKTGRIDSVRFRKDWGARMKNIHVAAGTEFDVTFYDFASYLADPKHLLNKYEDEHWSPIFNLCQPCAVKYDFIGKMENLQRDTLYALTKVVQSNIGLKLLNSTNFTNSSDVQLLHKYYSQIPAQTVRDLYKKYRPDFELFDYQFPWFAIDDFYFNQKVA